MKNSNQMELPELTLSPEDFHAKISALQENKQASARVRDQGYGQKSPVLLAKYNPDTQSWKTSQLSLVATAEDGLAEFSETWPRSGMMRNGTAYQLPNLARTITEIGSGLLPTPTTQDTPHAEIELTKTGRRRSKNGKSSHSLNLADRVMWPTPNASDNRDRGCMEDESIKRRLRIGKQVGLSTAVKETKQSGTLNPMWVEWLMGYPTGHTDLKDSETQ